MNITNRPVIHKTVKPRRHTDEFLPLIAYTKNDAIYVERTDTYHHANDIFSLLATEPRSIIVANGTASLLYSLHRQFHRDPLWQFACTPIEHAQWGPNRTPTNMRTVDLGVSFLGWRGRPLPDGPRGGKRNDASRFHLAIDPVTFAKKGISELVTPDVTECQALYIWGSQVRHFCYENGLKVRATAGAVSGQLLRDKRFYPNARRKVPSATNKAVRDQLPGNHYRLFVDEEVSHDAYYLDQSSAHHSCARDITFPNANTLRALGRFKGLEKEGRSLPRGVLKGHGLFYLKLSVPHHPRFTFPPPWGEESGYHYVYSNELPLLKSLGVFIESIVAAWVSYSRDRGLNRFAEWCLEQNKEAHTKHWKKPLLLSTYGILAATPRKHRVGYAIANGEKTVYGAGPHLLPVFERQSARESEPSYTNVIHRGMIEAECRQRSLALARDMARAGHQIMAVYADSVFVRARDPEGEHVPQPLPPAGWTIEACLTALRFHNPVSFTSHELQKLPGIPNRATVLRASFGTYGGPATERKARSLSIVS